MIIANTLGEQIVLHVSIKNILQIPVNPFSATTDLKGLKSAPEKSIAVTFHCIVPKLLWQWDENSCIHMRFEGDSLGDWKHNVGDFMEVRYMYI